MMLAPVRDLQYRFTASQQATACLPSMLCFAATFTRCNDRTVTFSRRHPCCCFQPQLQPPAAAPHNQRVC